MDLHQSIPTSFVPKSAAVAGTRRFNANYLGAFSFIGYGVFAVVFILAIGVFFYGRILSAQLNAKDAALTKAENSIDPSTVIGFVRLHDRLVLGEQLLKNHRALSGFYTQLETVLPNTVRLNSIHLSIDDKGQAKVSGAGVAKTFNALAATSVAFATGGKIKDAIFSGITVNKDNTVSFALSATLDPGLTAFSAP